MPTINLNRKVFEKLVGKKLSLDILKDRISMLGTDLEEINDKEIIVEVFPDRPDMLSEQGFARAFSSFINVKKGLKSYKSKKTNYKVVIEDSVKNVRPFTSCCVVRGLKFDDEKIREIVQIQEKLHITYGRNRKKVAIGIYPLEKIKWPIRFIALEPSKIKFRPLEGIKEMNAFDILKYHKAGREYGHLLQGLEKFPIFIDAKNNVLSMPPIINSHDVGKISEKTKDVFIECSGFDFNTLNKCLNIIVCALADIGGDVYNVELRYGSKKIDSPNLKEEKMKLKMGDINKMLGLKLREKDVKFYLEKMGYDYSKGNALIPCYRADILHEVDIIEDIAIAYGYENFKEQIPNISTIGEEDEFEKFKRKISEILIGFGLIEVSTFHVMDKKELNDKMLVLFDNVGLENSLTAEYNTLRSWLTPSLLKVLSENKHNTYPQNIFEIGRCVLRDKELDKVSAMLSGNKVNYTSIRQILDSLLNALELKYMIKEAERDSFIEGRVGSVFVSDKEVAFIGEIKPEVLVNWGLEMPVSCFELDLNKVFSILKK